MTKINLFSQYYVPESKKRKEEIDSCFINNILNPYIDKFHIFFEKESDINQIPRNEKIIIKILPLRLTYGEWLKETNKLNEGDISILVNSDILITESINQIRENVKQIAEEKRFIALTRYNPSESGLELNSNPHWTQDTWALVKGKEKIPSALIQEASFELGQPGCDNKISYIMHSYGFRISNPCKDIISIHLQEQLTRNYDSKENKLIGLHAFVHPSSSILDDSVLEFDLLTRNNFDPFKIRVNNWINSRKTYELIAQTQPDNPYILTPPDLVKIKLPNINLTKVLKSEERETTLLLKNDFYENEYKKICNYGSRFLVYEKDNYLYFLDKYWPEIKKLSINSLNLITLKAGSPDLFIRGFLPPVLELESYKVTDDMQYPEDIMYWQFPCRTEGSAYEVHKKIYDTKIKNSIANIYIGIPWATFIDKKQFNDAYLNLISSKIKACKKQLDTFGIKLKVHTVCQHIHWRKLEKWINEIQITDLWISHKEIGVENLGIATLHSWPLYAVNYLDKNRSEGLNIKKIDEKKYLASFIGAHMNHYLSDVRLKLNNFKNTEGYLIEINDLWHFNKLVYNYQVFGQKKEKDSIDSNEVKKYNEVLSDSIFSLCPVGAGPNSLRLWESLAIGAIPVVISDKYELPNIYDKNDQFIVFVKESNIFLIDKILKSYDQIQLKNMQKKCINFFNQSLKMSCFN